jgi:Fic family protein
MKKPAPPPSLTELLLEKTTNEPGFFARAMASVHSAGADRYMPWDQLRWRPAPDGLTPEDWWLITKLARNGMKRTLPVIDVDGREFSYALPDEVLSGIEVVDKHTSGRIGVPEPVTHDAPDRTRYVINSLIEEAITSSQLEGAQTTHEVAKDLLRTGRRPRTRDERMIINNYRAMQRVGEIRHQRLTPALICDLHQIVTEGTLEDAGSEGRPQLPGEKRVVIQDMIDGTILHVPPPADELPARLQRLCDFANDASGAGYVPPVVRAIAVHFMLAYDHPFEDGNGRTARVLFYWSMLNQDYWLAEFLSISRLLKKAPGQYARSFLHTEQDDSDLTYFVIFQLRIIQRAVTDLQRYLTHKVAETRRLQEALAAVSGKFNHRQLALLQHAIKNPRAQYTVNSHAGSHNVVPQTARMDLQGLERQGLLHKVALKRGHAWLPAADLMDLLEPAQGSVGRHRLTRSRGGGATTTPIPPASRLAVQEVELAQAPDPLSDSRGIPGRTRQ